MKVTLKAKYITGEFDLVLTRYRNNNRICLMIFQGGTPEAKLTTNIADYPLPANTVMIKTYTENEGVYEALVAAGIIQPMISSLIQNRVTIPICKLTDKVIEEFNLGKEEEEKVEAGG